MVFVLLGKGGVGKTTMACSLAWSLSGERSPVFLFSIDPAHNLYHFFDLEPAKGVVRIKEGLYVEEVDVDSYIKAFLDETSRKMKDAYRYLQVLNLEGMFDILKFSPGLQEWAMLRAMIERFTRWSSKAEHIVVDTPPTGLALRLLSLPFTGMIWIEKLLGLRKRILQRRDEVLRIKGPQGNGPPFYHTEDEDPVTGILTKEYEDLKALRELLTDSLRTRLCLVLNYDELSVQEGLSILEALRTFGIDLSLAVFNKATLGQKPPSIDGLLEGLSHSRVLDIPFFEDQVTPRKAMDQIGNTLKEALRDVP